LNQAQKQASPHSQRRRIPFAPPGARRTSAAANLRRFELVPGAGHWIQQERAQLTNTALIEFARATWSTHPHAFPPAATGDTLDPQFR
jgi:hypothetical protein